MIVSPKPLAGATTWLRTGHGTVPRLVREARRRQRRAAARRRSGSITAHMDAIVRDAVEGTRGSGRPTRSEPRP